MIKKFGAKKDDRNVKKIKSSDSRSLGEIKEKSSSNSNERSKSADTFKQLQVNQEIAKLQNKLKKIEKEEMKIEDKHFNV